MSSEKRLIAFLILSVASMYGMNYALVKTGVLPDPSKRPAPKAKVADAKADPKADPKADAKDAPKPDPKAVAGADEKAKDQPKEKDATAKAEPARPAGDDKAKAPAVPLVKPGELVLGSASDPSADAYHLRLGLDQRGGAVRQVTLARYEAEFLNNKPDREKRLNLIDVNPASNAPASLSIILLARPTPGASVVEYPLDSQVWEVVRTSPDGPVASPVSASGLDGEGQSISFRTKVADLDLTVTKTYTLRKKADGFAVSLKFDSPSKDLKVAYKLIGPHGIPIEGEWYTSTYRDVIFGQVNGSSTDIITRAASDVVSAQAEPEKISTLPLKFAGVENQYFATFVEPVPIPTSQENRTDSEAQAFLSVLDAKTPAKSDVGVEITSREFRVAPNAPVTHDYMVFAGPKTNTALAPFSAEDLGAYRKSSLPIPFASTLARYVIAPMLDQIYALTKQVAGIFGGKSGNYGIAIILLTMFVRLIMFPISRKQALISKKMQDLQPYLKEIQEKHKDDKEELTKATFALYKKHGFNPASGCLPALIQMPIFVGLWQALNSSVPLRNSSFLYIENLAAPDMLFKFPFELPLIGGFLGPYFNLLPLFVVALMMVQTKLFSPPATTPEQQQSQQVMKVMMVVMAVMFYKVPAGLGLYFITSSTWQIAERLLLPKIVKNSPTPEPGDDDNKGGNGGNGGGNAPKKPSGWLANRLEKLMAEAEHQRTLRNDGTKAKPAPGSSNPGGGGGDRDRDRPRQRPGKRR